MRGGGGCVYRKPERLRGGCGSFGCGLGKYGKMGGYKETEKAVFVVVVVCVRVVVGGLYGNPKRFVWRMVALSFSGNSLGFRGL